ncbi:MAG: hypothetical protein QXT64_01860 [Desulfurococcaceae archaeon]
MPLIDNVSNETTCTEEEKKDGVYMVCRDKNGSVVYEKKLVPA